MILLALLLNVALAEEPKMNFPVRMGPGLMKPAELCKDAKKRDPSKKIILVAVKGHGCDCKQGLCYRVTCDLSDTCNTFLQKNFAMYHMWGEHEASYPTFKKEWKDVYRPSIVFFDVDNCSEPIGSIKTEVGDNGLAGLDDILKYSAEMRYEHLENEIRKVLGDRVGASTREEIKATYACLKKASGEQRVNAVKVKQAEDLKLVPEKVPAQGTHK